LSAEAIPPANVEVSPPADAEALPSESACVFMLDGERCAVHVRQVRAVVTLGALTRVPGAPATLLGVTNVRGGVVPVVDLRPLLGLRAASGAAGGSAVVLEDGDVHAALVIDRVLGLERFDTAEPPPEASRLAAFACGALASADGTVTLLDGPTILATVRRAWAPVEDRVAS
jgi:purine-binding chemotaxis protein CheW